MKFNRKTVKRFLRKKKISPYITIRLGVDKSINIVEFLESYNSYVLGGYGDNESLTAGEAAQQYDVAVGEIGCRHCGSTSVGAIESNECQICGEKLL